VPRIVQTDGSPTTQPGAAKSYKFTGFKNIVNAAAGRKVLGVQVSNKKIYATAFAGKQKVSIHLVSRAVTKKQVKIKLSGALRTAGEVTQITWTTASAEVESCQVVVDRGSFTLTLPPLSYVNLKLTYAN